MLPLSDKRCIMNLILDIGNSAVKVSIFEDNKEIYATKHKLFDRKSLEILFEQYPNIQAAIISSVREDVQEVQKLLLERIPLVLVLDARTPVPVNVCYKTPATLGKDRLAAVVGARVLFPDENVLIFDSGTALTVEVLDAQGNYLGGNISPGLNMRFQALHQFTSLLPKTHMNPKAPVLGNDTLSAIQAGVQQGILHEVKSYIQHYENIYHSLKVVFTGGDAFFFVNPLKSPIFVVLNLVQIGLNRILEDYAKETNISVPNVPPGVTGSSGTGTK